MPLSLGKHVHAATNHRAWFWIIASLSFLLAALWARPTG